MNSVQPQEGFVKPFRLSPGQRQVVELAREVAPAPIRTKLVMDRFGWSQRKAWEILRRMRRRGIFWSSLNWITGRNGIHVPGRRADGTTIHYSWLELYLVRECDWGRFPDPAQWWFIPTKHRDRCRREFNDARMNRLMDESFAWCEAER